MKNLKKQFYLNEKLSKKLDEIVEKDGRTESKVLSQIVSEILSKTDIKFIYTKPKREQAKQEKRIRLTVAEIQAIEKLSASNSHSVNDEIIYILRGFIFKKDVMTKKEIDELRLLRNNLNVIGRNINQIARLANANKIVLNKKLEDNNEGILKHLTEIDKKLEELILKNADRWIPVNEER